MVELIALVYLLLNIHVVSVYMYPALGERCGNNIQCQLGSGGPFTECRVICKCNSGYIDCNGAASGGSCIAEGAQNPCTTTSSSFLSLLSSTQRKITEVTTIPINVGSTFVGSVTTSSLTPFLTSPTSMTNLTSRATSAITTPSIQPTIASSPPTLTALAMVDMMKTSMNGLTASTKKTLISQVPTIGMKVGPIGSQTVTKDTDTQADITLILLSCTGGLMTLNIALMSVYYIKRHFSAKSKVHSDRKDAVSTGSGV